MLLLFASTPMIVSAQETSEMRQDKLKVKLSDALFYQQLTQQSANAQVKKNVVFVSRKDPFVAGVLSLLTPGLGQVYNGEFNKGILQFLIVVSGYTLTYFAFEDDVIYSQESVHNGIEFDTRISADIDEDNGRGAIGFLVGFGTHIWSIVDAPLSANRINRRNESVRFSAAPLMKPNRVGAILTLRW